MIENHNPDVLTCLAKPSNWEVKDFELLVRLNVSNSALMNDAVYKFKRYEDASPVYTGINKDEGEAPDPWKNTKAVVAGMCCTPCGQSGSLCGLALAPSKRRSLVPPASTPQGHNTNR